MTDFLVFFFHTPELDNFYDGPCIELFNFYISKRNLVHKIIIAIKLFDIHAIKTNDCILNKQWCGVCGFARVTSCTNIQTRANVLGSSRNVSEVCLLFCVHFILYLWHLCFYKILTFTVKCCRWKYTMSV